MTAVVALAVAGPLGAFAYFHFVSKPAPDKLSLETSATTAPPGSSPFALSGTWAPTATSEVGYRVKEVAFGQSKEAVGRTSKVSGTMRLDGTTVSSVDLTVDMTSVSSDESRRDNQFRGRIMNVSQFPTARFKLTSPIALASADGAGPINVKATGDLTLRGTTKRVEFGLEAQRQGSNIAVSGSLPIDFDEWGIPNPSFGPISTEDHGMLELLVVFAKSA